MIVGAGAGGSVLAQRLARARLADRDPRGGAVLAPRRGLGVRRGRVARPVLDPEADHRRRGPDRAGQEQLRPRRRRLDGALRRLHAAVPPVGLRHQEPGRGRRGLADRLRGPAPALRAGGGRAAGGRAGLAVGPPAPLPALAAPGLRCRRRAARGRPALRDRDAGRAGRHRQRDVRQPPALHLPRLLPAGLQGQRQGQPVRHAPARRARPRRGGPGRTAWRCGSRSTTPPARARGVVYADEPGGALGCSAPGSSPSPATRSRRPGCCWPRRAGASRTAWATTRTRSAAT